MVQNILAAVPSKSTGTRSTRSKSGVSSTPRSPRELPSLPKVAPRMAMISIHGYVAGQPPLGAADTGGQVVYVLELSKKLAELGYQVDIWTRLFAGQPAIEQVAEGVRILRMPCGGPDFLPKEYLCDHLEEWNEHALRFIREHRLEYRFINSHYWDAGLAGQYLARALDVAHLHTPHSLGVWKKQQMETDAPQSAAEFERRYNFERRIAAERHIFETCDTVVATTPAQRDLVVREYGIAGGKVQMVPAGYDESRFFPKEASAREAIRARLGFRGKVILALGRLARNKGYDLLVDAFSLVAQREPDAMLLLAVGGEG